MGVILQRWRSLTQGESRLGNMNETTSHPVDLRVVDPIGLHESWILLPSGILLKEKVSLYILFILAVSTFWLEWLLIINYWLGRIYICHFCFLSFLFLFFVYLLFLFLSSSTSSFFCVKLDIFLVYHFNPVVFYYIFKGIFVVVILDSIVNI